MSEVQITSGVIPDPKFLSNLLYCGRCSHCGCRVTATKWQDDWREYSLYDDKTDAWMKCPTCARLLRIQLYADDALGKRSAIRSGTLFVVAEQK